jgi:predicted class III extradiol MEMO1 family dioxygenase
MPEAVPLHVRPAAVAGMFYPGTRGALAAEVEAFLAEARGVDPAPAGAAPKLIVVPHAGYMYSGAIAAAAYVRLAVVSSRVTRVVLLGPVHRVAVRGVAVPQAVAFETPLGRVAIDREAVDAIAGLPHVVRSDRPHAPEHSLEVQLPFLQAVLGTAFRLVPLAVGGDETLVVVSSDLSHYLAYDEARAVDSRTVRRIAEMATDIDPHEACGALALNGALLAASRHGLRAEVLDVRNSGDTAGDKRRVVGYAALAFAPSAPVNRE